MADCKWLRTISLSSSTGAAEASVGDVPPHDGIKLRKDILKLCESHYLVCNRANQLLSQWEASGSDIDLMNRLSVTAKSIFSLIRRGSSSWVFLIYRGP